MTNPLTLPCGRVLRRLAADDGPALQALFDSLGEWTRRRFQPHPLNAGTARQLCRAAAGPTLRLVVADATKLIAYFILEPQVSHHEIGRYREQGIVLVPGLDFMFAPVVADAWQGQGLASQAMPLLLALACSAGARSLVLMGGTQATNARAIAFYEKFGFVRHGGYRTEVFNHDMRCLLTR